MRLLPNEQRRAASCAGLLASDQDGEVVAAARALCGLLKKSDLDPATVVQAGLAAVSSKASATAPPGTYSCSTASSRSARIRMALYSPNLNDWERNFLHDVRDRRNLSERQERLIKDILIKAERRAA